MEIPTSLISQAHIHLQYLFCKLSNQYTLVSHFTCIYYCGIQCTILMQTSVWYQSAMGKAVLSRSDWHRNINWGVSFVSKNLLYVFSKIIHFDKAIEMFRLPFTLPGRGWVEICANKTNLRKSPLLRLKFNSYANSTLNQHTFMAIFMYNSNLFPEHFRRCEYVRPATEWLRGNKSTA